MFTPEDLWLAGQDVKFGQPCQLSGVVPERLEVELLKGPVGRGQDEPVGAFDLILQTGPGEDDLHQVGLDASQQTTMADLDRRGDLEGVYHVNHAIRDRQVGCFHQGRSEPDVLSGAVDQARFVCQQGVDGL